MAKTLGFTYATYLYVTPIRIKLSYPRNIRVKHDFQIRNPGDLRRTSIRWCSTVHFYYNFLQNDSLKC